VNQRDKERQRITEERGLEWDPERPEEVINCFQGKDQKTQEDEGVEQPGDRPSANHTGLEQNFSQHPEDASAEAIGTRAIRLAGQNVADFPSQISEKKRAAEDDEENEYNLFPLQEFHAQPPSAFTGSKTRRVAEPPLALPRLHGLDTGARQNTSWLRLFRGFR
jgi:hypothetical protein